MPFSKPTYALKPKHTTCHAQFTYDILSNNILRLVQSFQLALIVAKDWIEWMQEDNERRHTTTLAYIDEYAWSYFLFGRIMSVLVDPENACEKCITWNLVGYPTCSPFVFFSSNDWNWLHSLVYSFFPLLSHWGRQQILRCGLGFGGIEWWRIIELQSYILSFYTPSVPWCMVYNF